jgi:hypothetical protein
MKNILQSLFFLVCCFNAFAGEMNDSIHRYLSQKNVRTFCVLHELHPNYIVSSNIYYLNEKSPLNEVIKMNIDRVNDTSAFPELPYTFSFQDLYDIADLSGLKTSSNIARYTAREESATWRGKIYFFPTVKWIPKSISADSCYWIQGDMRRMPLLHSRDFISPGREFEWGSNAHFGGDIETDCRVLAFPKGTKIIETFGHTPDMRFTYGDWLVLLYYLVQDRSISYHVKFILPKQDAPRIEIETLMSQVRRRISAPPFDTAKAMK